MGRGGYLAITWRPGAAAPAQQLMARLDREVGWTSIGLTNSWRLWRAGTAELPVARLWSGEGLVIGEAFETPGARAETMESPAAPGNVADVARRLSRNRWGRYVALLEALDGVGVYRDPSGAMEALVWSPEAGIEVVASELERVPAWLRPRHWSLDWTRIGQFLVCPAARTTESLFDGVEAVGPGDLRMVWPREGSERIWSPAAFAREEIRGEDAAPELVRRVDVCTEALLGGHERVIVELSGGLDSSILAGTLGELGRAGRVTQWLNWNGGYGEADERAYARAVTNRIGVELTGVDMRPGRLEPSDLAELADALWPAMNGVDAARDRDETKRIAATGATAIVSGQGGDAIFFQMPSALVLRDAVRRDGLRALTGQILPELAHRRRESVWSILRQAFRPQGTLNASPLVAEALASTAAGLAHQWIRDAADLAPGKQLQIEAVASSHLYHGDSRRRRAAEVLHPLLAQPLVELCLAVPTPDLAGSAQDRAYARRVFASRLPDEVRRRRTKGAYNGYAGRLVANSEDVLKPFLMEGCLAEAGLLDRAALARALDPVAILQGGQPTQVMWAATVEAWVRRWQTFLPDCLSAPRPRP